MHRASGFGIALQLLPRGGHGTLINHDFVLLIGVFQLTRTA